MSQTLFNQYKEKLRKGLKHLEYSLKKIQSIHFDKPLGEEELEHLESYTARLSRVSDIFLSKYLKLLIKNEDPAFDGSVRDLCNFAEKKSYISSADEWMLIRAFRNSTAHDYEDEDLKQFFMKSRELGPIVVKTVNKLLSK